MGVSRFGSGFAPIACACRRGHPPLGRLRSALLVGAALCVAAPAGATEPTPPPVTLPSLDRDDPGDLPLANLSGQTDLLSRAGGWVQATCIGMADLGVSRSASSASGDLFARCQDLVQTGNSLLDNGRPTTFDLGFDERELAAAFLELAHDESGATSTSALQTIYVQARNVGTRIAALRQGATGISLAGLDLNGPALPTSTYPLLAEDSAAGADTELPANVGIFLNGEVNWGQFDGNEEEVGFDFDTWGLTAGADYRFNDNIFAGLALGYTRGDDDFESATRSELVSNGYTAHLYGGYTLGGFYADVLVSYTYSDFDLTRRIVFANVNRTARGDAHAHEISASVGGGYEFQVGGFGFGPTVRFEYTHIDIDHFTEDGAGGLNLSYDDQIIRSVITALGLQASYAISTSWGILLPQVRFDWQHEFENDSRRIMVHFDADPRRTPFFIQTARPDRNFYTLGVGVAATFARGLAAFVDYETVFDLRDITSHEVTGGVRYAF